MFIDMSKHDDKLSRKSSTNSNVSNMYSFEQQTANELNKYLSTKNNKDHYNNNNHARQYQQQQQQNQQQHFQAAPHHVLRFSNLPHAVNSSSSGTGKSKRHSTNFENYNSMNFNSFNSDALTAAKHIHTEQQQQQQVTSNSSSTTTTTPSSLGSDGAANTKPSSKEKILSYSYYTNLNYDKQKNSREPTPLNFSMQSANDSMNDHEHESSMSHLDVSHQAANQLLKRGGEKKIAQSKLNLSELSSQQQESEIFQKIMNKLAELPESIRLKNFNTEALRSSINELKNKEMQAAKNLNSGANSSSSAAAAAAAAARTKYFQAAPSNYTNLESNGKPRTPVNHETNLSKRSKYKSMFIENLESEHEKKLLNSLKNAKINVNSVAGDLMLAQSNAAAVSASAYKSSPLEQTKANADAAGVANKVENAVYLPQSVAKMTSRNQNSNLSDANKKNGY